MTEKQSHALQLVERDRGQLAPIVASALEMLSQSPPELVAAAMDKILAVQERYEAGEARKAFAAAIVAAKRELPAVIGYDKKNSFAGYSYSTLAAIVDGVTKALSRNDLSASWDVSSIAGSGATPSSVTVICKLTHCAGHVEVSPPMMSPVENTTSAAGKEKKTPAQAIMSAATSLKRMTIMSMLGLSSGEETSEEDYDESPRQQVVTDPVRTREEAGESIEAAVGRWKSALFTAETADDCERVRREVKTRLQDGSPQYKAMVDLYKTRIRELRGAKAEQPKEAEIIDRVFGEGVTREPGSDDA